jgi:hypothetical protein
VVVGDAGREEKVVLGLVECAGVVVVVVRVVVDLEGGIGGEGPVGLVVVHKERGATARVRWD